MYKKYLTNAVRHLRHSRLFTTLNILGLAIGISACMVIYRIVSFEFGYDRSLPDAAHIYRVVTGFKFDDKTSYNGGVSAPIYKELRKTGVGLRRVVPELRLYLKSVQVDTGQGKPLIVEDQVGVAATDSAYFGMVPYHWLAGSPMTAFRGPKQVVLTESRAKQYFPNRRPVDILDKTITYYTYRDTTTYVISGVVADLEGPTEFTNKEFCSLPLKEYGLNAWTNTNGSDKLYVQLMPQTAPANVVAAITTMATEKWRQFAQTRKEDFKFTRWYEIMPLAQSHFSTYINEYDTHKVNRNVLYGLLGVAAFLLALACINYINMGVASIPQRAKEIGVRKTLGSGRRELIGQFLMETFITALAASVVAYFLGWAEFALLKNVIPVGLNPFGDVLATVLFMVALAFMTTFLSGLYPGWLITKVKTIQVFRHAFVLKGGGRFGFQKALIVFQFVIAITFITGALIVGRQLHYVVDSDMGFNKDAVVLLDVPYKYSGNPVYKNRQFALLAELRALPGVQDIVMGEEPLSSNYHSGEYTHFKDGKAELSRQLFVKEADTGYIRMYGFKLVAGRNVLPTDTSTELVINETAVRAFGFKTPQDALGQYIGQRGGTLYPIVGVISDFHTQNFYTAIDPVALTTEKEDLTTFNIKLKDQKMANWPATLKEIEKKWYAFYPPESFKYKFYDDSIAEMYKDERNLNLLINLTTVISIVISCLGLFGLAVLTALQRTKEIGIRKVLGASVGGIVALLSRQYLRMVVLAFVIATPLAWWGANKWLQNFAYKIELHWWFFALAGLSGVAVAFLTVGFHALKAANANPVKSLRTE